jgi:cyclopropane-fatty-acyl-phospholipid synthase
MLWSFALRKLIKKGRLTVTDANGTTHHFGGSSALPSCAIRLHDRSLHYKLLLKPDLYFGEAYMDKTLTIEQGDIRELMTLFCTNIATMPKMAWEPIEQHLSPLLSRLQQMNPLQKSKENVAHHYDLSEQLYRLFLDKDMQYSCAYFETPQDSLEQAQYNKKAHIAAKLRLQPGMKVLDIGCGWGGMAIFLAKQFGVEVIGITLSEEQYRIAVGRASAEGLSDKVKFELRDYRDVTGQYDRIVSVGMFEHVGLPHYKAFFKRIESLLTDDGIALIHSIGRMDGPGTTPPWLRKYIFPGGYAPALSEVLPHIEHGGLFAGDIEILHLHYAETLKAWHQRFVQNRLEISTIYDERFCRMWEFFLLGAEMDFRYLGTMVFQIQLVKNIRAIPMTRDYMYTDADAY